jgi:hypothetical protein
MKVSQLQDRKMIVFNLTPYSLDQNLGCFLCENEQSEYTKNGLSFGSMRNTLLGVFSLLNSQQFPLS